MKKEHQVQGRQIESSQYKGLPKILHSVRWTQHLLAIVAEVLILLAFAMSGMDANLGGVMTGIPWLKWAWATAFALGIDTSFVISWVRVRKCTDTRNWGALSWSLLLAVGMSFIVFQPVAIQLLQQSLAINFNQALSELGINIVILVYGRALVAVFLGAILAMTNVESAMEDKQVTTASAPKRRLAFLDKALNKIAPVVISEQSQPAQVMSTPDTEQEVEQQINIVKARLAVNTSNARAKNLGLPNDLTIEQWVGLLETTEGCCSYCDNYIGVNNLTLDHITPVSRGGASTLENIATACLTCNQRKGRYDKEPGPFLEQDRKNMKLSIIHNFKDEKIERVRQVLKDKPECSLRELGRLSGLSAATAKKYKTLIEQECLQAG